ncbi:DNA mismatch repair protein MutS2 [Spirosomataceae bacterium TFI 002]|nr:DNA mismatch repair protein MutS2 [Spirosomataceae bacterium TFI 002]
MLYPENIEVKIGFDKIKELLIEECESSMGVGFVNKISFSSNFNTVKKLIGQSAEFKEIIQLGLSFPSQNFIDPAKSFARASLEGSFLDQEEFFDIKLSLSTIQQILDFFKNKEEHQYPLLKEVVFGRHGEMMNNWHPLIAKIESVIDERGQVRDNASPELQRIRKSLISEQNNVRRTLEKIFKTALNSGWIESDMSMTVRNGRLVIPVFAEHKRKMKGFVHDETASGKIAFVEPNEVLEANNEIRDLEIKERREVIKILEKLTDELRPSIPVLRKAYGMLGIVDFIRAKAKFALKVKATSPLLVNERVIEWRGAIHPILYLAHQKVGKPTIPLTVELTSKNRILVVSGPNAGGKSVMLKTIGLIQYMAQCGLLVPTPPDAKVGIFEDVFMDIGDEQSIENDLSTYSSHLTNMKFFLMNANKKTLFLIDEFGTGTEPNLGGAIAESILEDLVKSRALGVVNTHYTNLKIYADKNEGLLNGAMKFDGEKLDPLYELEMNKPGSSFALEVAQKIGLPAHVIKKAKRKVGTQQVDFEKMLKELEIEKAIFTEKNQELISQNRKAKQKLEQYSGLKDFLDIEKSTILNKAKEDARNLLKKANKQIENTIREIKEQKASKEETKNIRKELEEFEKVELKTEKPKVVRKDPEWVKEEGAIEVGSFVRIKDNEAIGEVLRVRGKDIEIAIGQLKTNVKINRLEKISKKTFKEGTGETPKPKRLGGIDLNEKMANFSFNLDIRGKRGEEALVELDNLMNDALLLGYPELRILHGKGDGILRNLVRSHLKGYKQVAKMEDEHADRGGHGVTIVKMA